MKPRVISAELARNYLVGQLGLRQIRPDSGPAAIQALLRDLRCIQLDPLDKVGTNADLVVHARMDGTKRGDVYDALLPGHAFEHFFKERCLLPPSSLPHYRARLAVTGWWRLQNWLEPPPEDAVASVLEEIRQRGPSLARDLSDRGLASPRVSHAWVRKAPSINDAAVVVLASRCDLVVVARTQQGKRYDLAERVMPEVCGSPPDRTWERFVLLERAEAAGLLSRNAGPWWAQAKDVRTSPVIAELVGAGELEVVQVEGLKRKYLAPAGFADRTFPDDDGRMRVLGPLDPLMWDRALVEHLWGFDYIWEVYKPAKKRVWGYYVCPLLHEGRLVGRFEGARADGRIDVLNRWTQDGEELDETAFDDAMNRLAAAQ